MPDESMGIFEKITGISYLSQSFNFFKEPHLRGLIFS